MSMTPENWLERHSLLPAFDSPRRLSKASSEGVKMGVVLLAQNNAATIGRHLLLLQHGWPGGASPWKELLVADLGSSDSTIQIAQHHGAKVLEAAPNEIKNNSIAHGDGLVRAMEASESDVLLVAPASLVRLDLLAVAALVAAMLDHPACRIAWGSESAQGSSLSRISLRPLLAALCPALAVISDPASPVLAIRPRELKDLPIARTNGYEAALAIDCWNRFGLESLVQVLTGPLQWSGTDPRKEPTHSFRAILAALEALRRAGRIQAPGEFGHILPTPEAWNEQGPRVVSRLEVFPWKAGVKTGEVAESKASHLTAWFHQKE